LPLLLFEEDADGETVGGDEGATMGTLKLDTSLLLFEPWKTRELLDEDPDDDEDEPEDEDDEEEDDPDDEYVPTRPSGPLAMDPSMYAGNEFRTPGVHSSDEPKHTPLQRD